MEQHILAFLQQVEHERERRQNTPQLARAVDAVKRYQQQRFRKTYADLLADPRYAGAATFFLNELYGPEDFSLRDAQFARVVPALVRLFPTEVVQTVALLAQLHALSERLDSLMGAALQSQRPDAVSYAQAWRQVGESAARRQQIELTLSIGASLDALTRKSLLRQALRLMRGPAYAAGLGELQRFLETGFDTFKTMKGAKDFLDTVQGRETRLAHLLSGEPGPTEPSHELLEQLP
ncbi:MAG: hypothetical protein JOY60_06635 [Burkholderiaceae bacterium]|nr:hypothetical protein [Roseateles sp.]MBV8469526.1 hypothetical protein [Burkholderiaceae bacterium]